MATVLMLPLPRVLFHPTGVPGASHVYVVGKWAGTIQRNLVPGKVWAYSPTGGHRPCDTENDAVEYLASCPARSETTPTRAEAAPRRTSRTRPETLTAADEYTRKQAAAILGMEDSGSANSDTAGDSFEDTFNRVFADVSNKLKKGV